MDDIILPTEINGKIVTKIGNAAFQQTQITYVNLPEKLKTIGEFAFMYCEKLTDVDMYNEITDIGQGAFAMTLLEEAYIPPKLQILQNLTYTLCPILKITFPSNGMLHTIGDSAFLYCAYLTEINLPNTVTSVGEYAFAKCKELKTINLNSNLTNLSKGAFEDCEKLEHIDIPDKINFIYEATFKNCKALQSITLKNSISDVKASAFQGCENLTIYSTRSKDYYKDSKWNVSARPVFWNCAINNGKVTEIVKSDANMTNANAVNGINNPYCNGYTFGGWYVTSDFSGEQYGDIAAAPDGNLYASWTSNSSGGGNCIAEGSLITLADGSQVTVENLKGDEELLVWNMYTGKLDKVPILFIDSDPRMEYEVIKLRFSDGTTVEVISEHGFFDITLNKYVYLSNDAEKYIGHLFKKQNAEVRLVGVDIVKETTTAWSPVTAGHLCYYVNGMLTMPGGIEGLFNIFEVDGETMSYDKAQMEADIEEYGLYTYEEFVETVIEVPEGIFEAFNGRYLKVAIGKGLIDTDRIVYLVNRYARFF